MKFAGRSLFILAAALALSAAGPASDPTKLVNEFIGTGGHGHTHPGATLPFGMVQLGPDTYNDTWDWCSGYHYSDSSIMGFSHTHLSGTGIGDMLDVLVMPGTGAVKTVPGTREKPEEGYRSRFSHAEEKAEPGYYSVMLKDYGIQAELSATARAGIHKYTFPQSDTSHFIVDLTHVYGGPNRVRTATLEFRGNDTLVGGRTVNGWARGRQIYFAMKFSKPFQSQEVVEGRKAVIHYTTSKGEVIYVKTGISSVSIEGAMQNLDREIPAFDFAAVRQAAHAAWQKELSKLAVEGGDAKQRAIFYTALYHTMAAPTLYDDVDGQYRGMDGQVHKLPAGQHNYSTFSLWDTYRAEHPLFTLMEPERVTEFVNCLIRMSEESPAGMPVWPLQGYETGTMTGYHSASVIAEAAVKGFKGIDFARAYGPMRKRALEDDFRGLGYFRKLGYIPSDKVSESATRTLEYSYDAWAVAQVAKILGKSDDYEKLIEQSKNYRHLFDKSVGFIRPKLENGEWAPGFDPTMTGTTKKWRDFTESNSWQGTWAAQHEPEEYIDLLGSAQAFVKKLDDLFTVKVEIKGEVPADMTGLVGMYAHGNEPSHHVAYLYDYAGAPAKTQERVRDLLDHQYDNQPDGLAGNEDCGQMSAWYVISALGFYAVNPASGNYAFGSPLFDKVTVDMGGNHHLTIEVKRSSPSDKYIQSVTLNGKPYDKFWFSHAAIAQGGSLVFKMSAKAKQ
ncbi:MAG TPA: GH92 family glycosyl hydrolase [Candidatus Sulfopaludibacter sp.]|jgi:predicted alpha-1,2-mannosidase|nr:GH92 family glycosyl hydrolase [Candidatus Sulfopaludibacter sp.]